VAERVLLQHLLREHRETVHALAHIGLPARRPFSHAVRRCDHPRNAANTRLRAGTSTRASTRVDIPRGRTISIRPDGRAAGGGQAGPLTGYLDMGEACCLARTPGHQPATSGIQQPQADPCVRAIASSGIFDDRLSETIACFCSNDQRRRRSQRLITSSGCVRALIRSLV
jgi:hypothetical protein